MDKERFLKIRKKQLARKAKMSKKERKQYDDYVQKMALKMELEATDKATGDLAKLEEE